jgi:hypothetical protein
MVSPTSYGSDPYSSFYHSELFIRGQERAIASQIQMDDNFHESAKNQTEENYPSTEPL